MNKLVTLLLIVFVCFAFCQIQADAFEDQEDGENSSGSGRQEPAISQEEEMPTITQKKPTENQDPEDSKSQEKPAMKPKTKEMKPKESEEPEVTQDEEKPSMKKDPKETEEKPEKTTMKEKKPKEMETEDEQGQKEKPKKSSQDEEKPAAQEAPKLTKKQYVKIMRCIFNCSSRYNWSSTVELFPKCGEKLDCYQDSFDKALKVLKPCIYKCMTSPFDQFN
jgi:hypothetical protein